MTRHARFLVPFFALALACPTWASFPSALQNGDKAGEEQPALDRQWPLPPSPPLTPEQQQATFRLPEGYTIQAVATEPLIGDPVDITWDARGRMWVVEMTSLMRDADATGELEPDCSIVILSDTDGDQVYDHREVFLPDLVLPRSVCFVPGGVVAILPPQIVFLQDLDGDGRPDHREVIADGLTAGLSNPEHAANSLTLGLDNWLYVANHGARYRRVDGVWRSEKSARIGQWGMAEDDLGRMAVNYNSSAVHVSVVPLAAAVRNEAYGTAAGVNLSTTRDTRVYSSRVNPGVNRGYRKETLREDGHLAKLTGACGPAWFTGTALALEDRGRLFSCEPCGNLVQRFEVTEEDDLPKASHLRNADGLDFLTSTDERFRPVNLRVGPDGALYVVDMYRGILQHRVFLTSFLRRQAEERELVTPTGLGRIWRIAHVDGAVASPTDLSGDDPATLISRLAHPNAWQRRTAQRLLLEGGTGVEGIDSLRALAFGEPWSMAGLHALWTLEGLGISAEEDLLALSKPQVGLPEGPPNGPSRLAARLRVGRKVLEQEELLLLTLIGARGEKPATRWLAAHMVGELRQEDSLQVLLVLLEGHPKDKILVAGLLAGLSGREWQTAARLTRLFAGSLEVEAKADFLKQLARCTMRRHRAEDCRALLMACAADPDAWTTKALLQGAVAGLPQRKDDPRYRFALAQPEGWQELKRHADLGALVAKIEEHVAWGVVDPSTPGTPEAEVSPLLRRGAEVYARSCGTCHQPDGAGMAGLAPPFAGSEWLALPDHRLIDIALNGMQGPIEVAGQAWDQEMPGWPTLTDQEIAEVLSYILHRWGAEPRTLDPAAVAEVRAD